MQWSLVLLVAGFVLSGAACRRAPQGEAAPDPVPSSEPRQVRIGGQTIPAGSSPAFYVIDGAIHRPPVDLSTIDPADILTVELIRGDAAVTRFGANAREGVVVITTKRAPSQSDRRPN